MRFKTIFKMALYMIIGGVVGALGTIAMISFSEANSFGMLEQVSDFFVSNRLYLIIGIFIVLFIPALVLVNKGKAISKTMENDSDEEIERKEKIVDRYLGNGLTLAQVFMFINFMILGLTLSDKKDFIFVFIAMFMINSIASSYLEISTIKHIQKYDKRIKGDPTSLKFSKDFINSLDEAEQEKAYKAGYKTFQFSRALGMALIIFMILIRVVFNVGGFAIFTLCVLFISQSIALNHYSKQLSKLEIVNN